jgi:hypothetical protein
MRFTTTERFFRREKNMHAMRMGPGKHLEGRILMDGIVRPEEVCFSRILSQIIISDHTAPVRLLP